MTSFSKYFKEQFPKMPRSHDKEIYTLINLISDEPFNEIAFKEIANKVLQDYQKIYTNTHPNLSKEISLLKNITTDTRMMPFLKEVELTYNALQQMMIAFNTQPMRDDQTISALISVVVHTNNIQKYMDLKTTILSVINTQKKPGLGTKISNFFKKIFVGTTVVTTLGVGHMQQNQIDGSVPNKQAMEIQLQRAREMENKRISLMEAAKKLEEKTAKKFREDYDLVARTRKDVMIQVDKILSKAKMPTAYLKPEHIKALIFQESHYDPDATSSAGAYGLMQVMGGSSDMSMEENIKAGLKILKEKEEYCRKKHPNWDKLSDAEKIDMLFAVYNCGEGKMNRDYNWDILQANRETRDHITYIHAYWKYT